MGFDKDNLTETQKQTISALSTLAAGLAGGLAGNSTSSTVTAAQAGKNAVENNALGDIMENKVSGVTQAEKYKQAQQQLVVAVEKLKAQHCVGLGSSACSAKLEANRNELLKGITDFGIDFVPVVGDIKSIAEAQSALDYLVAAIGVIPGAGDAAGKAIKAAEIALKKGDVGEASKLINKASGEISAHNVATYPKFKNDLRQQNLDNIAKQDPRLAVAIKGDGTGKVDFGMGAGSREEADRLGMIWLGDGAKKTSGGGWISADGTRGYRPPSAKDSPLATTGTQANFESYVINSSGKSVKVGNGHLNISD